MSDVMIKIALNHPLFNEKKEEEKKAENNKNVLSFKRRSACYLYRTISLYVSKKQSKSLFIF